MPLSEEEMRLLEQMERALAAEDPKFVSTLQGRTLQRAVKVRAAVAAVVFLGGVALLLGGAMARMTWLGIVGFVVMLASATIGLAAWRGRHVPDAAEPAEHDHPDHGGFRLIEGGRAHKPRAAKAKGGFMHRMEQRWNDRRNQGF